MLVASLEHHSTAPLIAPKICARVGDNARTRPKAGWSGANLTEENYDESQEKTFNRTSFGARPAGLLSLGSCSQCRSPLPGTIFIAVRSALGPGSASGRRVSAQIRGCPNARVRGDPGREKRQGGRVLGASNQK
jgi:hypothetical protein